MLRCLARSEFSARFMELVHVRIAALSEKLSIAKESRGTSCGNRSGTLSRVCSNKVPQSGRWRAAQLARGSLLLKQDDVRVSPPKLPPNCAGGVPQLLRGSLLLKQDDVRVSPPKLPPNDAGVSA